MLELDLEILMAGPRDRDEDDDLNDDGYDIEEDDELDYDDDEEVEEDETEYDEDDF